VLITRITLRVISGYVTLDYITIIKRNLYLLTNGLKEGSTSILCCIIIFFHLFSTRLIKTQEKSSLEVFLSGILGVIPTFINLFTLIFLLYLIIYRGIWTLSELNNGFSLITLLKFVIFTGLGLYGYIPFTHLYMLKKYIKSGNEEKATTYIFKHKLLKL